MLNMKTKNTPKQKTKPQENKKAALVTILQLTIVLMLAATTAKPYIGQLVFFAAQTALSVVFLKIIFLDLKKELKQEHKFTVYFFAPIYLIAQSAWILSPLASDNAVFFIALVLSVFIYAAIFRILFGKNHTIAKVILSNDNTAVLQTDYDIRYFCTRQTMICQTDKKLKEGTTAKIVIKRDFFGKKTAKIFYDD